MNHLPYKDWLFEDEPLDREQKKALQSHLSKCESCRSLADSWSALHYELKHPQLKQPRPGFTSRWQATLAKKQAEQQRRLTWWIFGASLAVFLIGLGILYIPEILSISPGGLLASYLFTFTALFIKANQMREIAEIIFFSMPPFLSISVWVLAASGLSLLCLGWAIAIWKIIMPKGARS